MLLVIGTYCPKEVGRVYNQPVLDQHAVMHNDVRFKVMAEKTEFEWLSGFMHFGGTPESLKQVNAGFLHYYEIALLAPTPF